MLNIKMKKKSKDEIIETLYQEIERKNSEIKKLKEENLILIKTALKASEKQRKAEEIMHKKKNK